MGTQIRKIACKILDDIDNEYISTVRTVRDYFRSRHYYLAVGIYREHPWLLPYKLQPPVVGCGTNVQVGGSAHDFVPGYRRRDNVERLVMAAHRLREIIHGPGAETRGRKRIKRADFVHFIFRFERANLISSGKCDFHICTPKGPNTVLSYTCVYYNRRRARIYVYISSRMRIRWTGRRRNWREERGPFEMIESI